MMTWENIAQESLSDLGLDDVDLGELDLSQLVGGQGFNANSQVAMESVSP